MTAEVALLIALSVVVAMVCAVVVRALLVERADRRAMQRDARLMATTISRSTDHQLEIPTVRRRARK